MPFLFIVGAEDQIFPPDAIRDASRLVANAQVSVISAAGHSPYFEQPRAWNDVFARFLTSTSK
jgi:2-succinyl-6-hydroxy-2,4-cyclohexadiene-1-carboxylate synthase